MSRQPRRRTLLVTLATALALAVSSTSGWAHPRVVTNAVTVDEPPAPIPAGAPALPAPATRPTDPFPPTLALAVALGIALTARRRVLVAGLALGLAVLAVETGVHSVHHLADRQAAAECVVAVASANIHGTADSPPATRAVWIPVPVGAVVAPAPERPGARPLRPDEGRAPPTA